MADKRPALGRGLSALIPDAPLAPARRAPAAGGRHRPAPPNRFQPRGHVDDARDRRAGALDPRATASSSRSSSGDRADGYEIVAGERRWRASQRAGLLKVPVVVRDIPDDRLLAAALIENIQREDLNPIEEAQAYRRLADEFGLTQEQIAEAVGKDRSSVANYVRLLKLPARDPRERRGRRAVDGARPRAAGPRRRAPRNCGVARDVVAKSLSVRETEALVEEGRPARRGKRASQPKDVHTRAAEDGCASRSARACASSARAAAAGSRSTSPTKTSCSACTST